MQEIQQPLSLDQSQSLWATAERKVPGGTHTNSKRVSVFAGVDHYPAFIERGDGTYVTDIDGNRYIDCVAALAPIVLGYNIPSINEAIRTQLDKGILFSLPSPIEVTLAETLIDLFSWADQCRFFKSGAETVSAAIRAARIKTGRDMIVCGGYHGWHDWWSTLVVDKGIPQAVRDLTVPYAFNDLAGAEKALTDHRGNVAALTVTPALYGQDPEPGFLEGLRALTDQHDVPLIFDEIITGFRYAVGGATERYGVEPDLGCYAKAMANGMPMAALMGRSDYMDPITDNWVTSTYSGEALSIAASLETIHLLKTTGAIPHMYSLAERLNQGLEALAPHSPVGLRPFAPLPAMVVGLDLADEHMQAAQTAILRGCASRGVLVRRDPSGISLCLNAAMTPANVDAILNVLEDTVKSLGT